MDHSSRPAVAMETKAYGVIVNVYVAGMAPGKERKRAYAF